LGKDQTEKKYRVKPNQARHTGNFPAGTKKRPKPLTRSAFPSFSLLRHVAGGEGGLALAEVLKQARLVVVAFNVCHRP